MSCSKKLDIGNKRLPFEDLTKNDSGIGSILHFEIAPKPILFLISAKHTKSSMYTWRKKFPTYTWRKKFHTPSVFVFL